MLTDIVTWTQQHVLATTVLGHGVAAVVSTVIALFFKSWVKDYFAQRESARALAATKTLEEWKVSLQKSTELELQRMRNELQSLALKEEVGFRRAHQERYEANLRFHVKLLDAQELLRKVLDDADGELGAAQFSSARTALHNLRKQADAEIALERSVVRLAIAHCEESLQYLEHLSSLKAELPSNFVLLCGDYHREAEARFTQLVGRIRASLDNLEQPADALSVDQAESNRSRSTLALRQPDH